MNDCDDLDFSITCLFYQAIEMSEFKLWICNVIRDTPQEEIPLYMFDLLDFDDALASIDKTIGFVTHGELSEKDKDALTGIAFLRGVDVYDPPVPKSKAIQSLKESPEIYKRFKKFFPFIELPEL